MIPFLLCTGIIKILNPYLHGSFRKPFRKCVCNIAPIFFIYSSNQLNI
jgi:hypothetical protein